MTSVELFSGAGGLALGIAKAGFDHEAVIEFDKDTCITLQKNKSLGVRFISDWPIHNVDVRNFDYKAIKKPIDLLAGGPPCQPFSIGGKHGAFQDTRDMFPEAVRAVRETSPKAFMFENVKGLLRESFAKYFSYIQLQLTYPELVKKEKEDWMKHLSRLERHHTQGKITGLNYRVVFRLLNSANYGVPQKRERVFIVGFRSDLRLAWSFPNATHSQEALWRDKWITEEYWNRHKVPANERQSISRKNLEQIAKKQTLFNSSIKAWNTVRDALSDLPDPKSYDRKGVLNHQFMFGAKSYVGHTGSYIDEPAKTLKAGDHGVPGGENMLLYPNGEVRYFTVRESARIQGFPDDYSFPVSWTESMRQLGNAVPVNLGYAVAENIAACLKLNVE